MLSFIYRKWSTKRHNAYLIVPVTGGAPIREWRLLNYFFGKGAALIRVAVLINQSYSKLHFPLILVRWLESKEKKI